MNICLVRMLFLFAMLTIIGQFGFAEQRYDPAKTKEYTERSLVISDLLAARRVVETGDLLALHYPFGDLQLAVLDVEQLRLLRNTVFAQYGLIFKSADLDKHFRSLSWYKPAQLNVDDSLSDVDKYNVALIQLYERLQMESTAAIGIGQKDLIGMWHPMPMVAAGWMQRLFFYPDGAFVYSRSQDEPYRQIAAPQRKVDPCSGPA